MNLVDFFQRFSELKSSPHVFWRLEPHFFKKESQVWSRWDVRCHSFVCLAMSDLLLGEDGGSQVVWIGSQPLSKWEFCFGKKFCIDWNNGCLHFIFILSVCLHDVDLADCQNGWLHGAKSKKPCDIGGVIKVARDESYFPILNRERSKKPRILKITG